MLGAARWTLVPALLAGWLLLPNTALAIVPQVHDNGKFFDSETIKKANAIIKEIEMKYKKDVVVETFDSIPDDVLKRFKYDENSRDLFFEQWVASLAEDVGDNGIVILIGKDQFKEGRVQIGVGKEPIKRDFTKADRTELSTELRRSFKEGKYNSGLLDGLQFVEKTLAAHHAGTAVAQQRTPAIRPVPHNEPVQGGEADHAPPILGWICIGLCVLLGVWLVVGIFRAITGGGGGYAGRPGYGGGYGAGGGYGGGYGGGGGGGFMSGLFGGLFGAMAGNWIYNTMFGGQSYHQGSWGQSSESGNQPTASGDASEPSDQGQGFTSTGGDFDPGGGGGDADGGDAGGGGGGDWGGGGDTGGGGDAGGGGDWGGGGDTGGGGGDWGGGGGDWGGGGGGDTGGGGGDW